ncbi:MAG: AAA family ATPase [Moorea sp. SIOASIH]|uniref:AAA family ATPase n=1 Tax=Moorena sp. SIOASIH TaxID=2607817 RepID=UPI0013BD6FE9|nr:AAA family ATPase [Moorena sp. SIOASIH]NEO37845.1 AAA family ATPase [Moorena sp. SIOASIH]
MTVNIQKLYKACNPSKTLTVEQPEDRKYYIDFSSVRGGKIIEELKDNITFFSTDEPTCELFTGHIGCGKSTELLRLKAELEEADFHVVYFESSQDLEMGDVDVGDILLAIARRVSESLDKIKLGEPKGFKKLLAGAAKLLLTEIELSGRVGVPGIGEVGVDSDGAVSLAVGIGEITAKAKDSPDLRSRLRQYLEPQTNRLLEVINQELLEPAIANLQQLGKQGLVVIVDNLDRVDASQKPWGRDQPEYLFVDRGAQLKGLHCHVVYTMPLALRFSNDYSALTQRFVVDPKVLPMVPVRLRDGTPHEQGMALLRQMVLARAFPNLKPLERLARVKEVFDSPDTLDRLCYASGGHVRNLLRFLSTWIKKERRLPLSQGMLETVIRDRRNELTLPISDDEWELLCHVAKHKKVVGDEGYQVLIRSMFVYEYRDQDGSWFDVNPILAEAEGFKSCLAYTA